MRVLHLVIIPLAICTVAAQQPPCNQAIPVNVVIPDGRLVRQIGPEGFVARNKNEPARILSVTTDHGPRRIVFIAEDGKAVPAVARKIESIIISAILSKARAEDSFALLTARGPEEEVPFGATPAALKTAVEELEKSPKGRSEDNGVLDALLQSSDLFQQVQTGDAVVLLTMGLESPHRASFAKVRAALAKGHIRVFGCLMGQFVAGYIDSMPPGMAPQSPGILNSPNISPNLDNIYAWARDTGGFVFHENTEAPWKEFKLTDESMKRVKYLSEQTYKAVTECYLVEIESPSRELTIDLADPVRAQVPAATVLYPRLLPECSAIVNDKAKPQ